MDKQTLEAAVHRLVDNEVHLCLSSLIYAASQNWEAATKLGFGEDDLYTLASRRADASDYYEALPSDVEMDHGDDVQAWSEAFTMQGLEEPDGREIFEHWAVSDWLADKLEARGESIVRDCFGLTIWGRATTGQMIAADSVIEDIARELHPECRACAAATETRLLPCDECGAQDGDDE